MYRTAMNDDLPSIPRRAGKWARIRAPSDSWRQRLLSNCLTRLKTSREEILSSRRATRINILHQEADRARFLQTSTDSIPPPLTDAELNALADELEQVLQQERQEEETRMLMDVEHARRASADDLAQLVAFHERNQKQEQGVVCPVCGVNKMSIGNGRMRCSCGLDVMMATNAVWTEENVQAKLANVVETHTRICPAQLRFWQDCVPTVQGSFLWTGCVHCGVETIAL